MNVHLNSHISVCEVENIAQFIRSKCDISPTIGVICGSGLGKLAESVDIHQKIPYSDIPGFPCSLVVGHNNNLVFGKLGSKSVVMMQGRFHLYEGFSKLDIAIPIRVLKLLGVKTLLMASATGGLNDAYNCGDIVIIKDHISFPSLSLKNVLIGPNESKFGERFVPLSDAYSSNLRKLAKKTFDEMGLTEVVHEGVYVHSGGPSYETPAECKMLKLIGADVVGMSTAPEVILARHCGMEVFVVALVTNKCVMDVESKERANHEEVVAVANTRTNELKAFFTAFIQELPN